MPWWSERLGCETPFSIVLHVKHPGRETSKASSEAVYRDLLRARGRTRKVNLKQKTIIRFIMTLWWHYDSFSVASFVVALKNFFLAQTSLTDGLYDCMSVCMATSAFEGTRYWWAVDCAYEKMGRPRAWEYILRRKTMTGRFLDVLLPPKRLCLLIIYIALQFGNPSEFGAGWHLNWLAENCVGLDARLLVA